ncbi:hypothetical protein AVDCRST_MAG94-1845 [uncultured Leptolyngbya sp.]|uniref:Uncharacterized protein n=1 Tax=uncultured Leptolyngbya sp. TaxID=332963 RepID=A0A6J4LCY4_9CYAN|nr:hypothetical protein AVDCRST_MAG94-1845 [uncultured Leptolyngbya sp.]
MVDNWLVTMAIKAYSVHAGSYSRLEHPDTVYAHTKLNENCGR